MSKLIKLTEDLPEKFKLSNYAGMDRLSASDWFALLDRRLMIYLAIDTEMEKMIEINEDNDLKVVSYEESLMTMVNWLFDSPLAKTYISDDLLEGVPDEHRFISEENYSYIFKQKSALRAMDVGDFCRLGIFADDYSKLDNTHDQKLVDVLYDEKTAEYFTNHYPLTVNLNFSDKEIMIFLQHELAEIRSKLGVKPVTKPYTKQTLQYWSTYNLLPYFDLQIWAKLKGYTLTRSLITKAIYMDKSYGDDTLRKSVEQIYNSILLEKNMNRFSRIHNGVFDLLASLAATEKSGKKTT